MLVAHAKRRIHAPSELVHELLADLERPKDQDVRAWRVRCECYLQTVEGYTELVRVEEVVFPPPWSAFERWLRPYVQRALDHEVDRAKARVESVFVARLRAAEPGVRRRP